MTFRPYPTRSGFIFLGATVISAALTIYLATLIPQQESWANIFQLIIGLLVTLASTGLALYWATIAFKLQYHLNRNGLAIQWGLIQQRIPFNAIEKIIPGKNLPTIPNFRGVNIAGLQFGRAQLADYGPIKIQTTAPPADSLLIVTPNQSYLISPHAPDNFIRAWQARQTLGPTQQWSTGVQRSWPFNIPMLTDPLTWWLLGLAALIFLGHFGYLTLKFSDLPAVLPIHFNALGQADRIADKSDLLTLPAAGAIVLIFNTLLGGLFYGRDKMAAYLLWGSAIFLQLCLWVAVLTLTA